MRMGNLVMASLQGFLTLLFVFLLSYPNNKRFSMLLRATHALLSKSLYYHYWKVPLKWCRIATESIVLCFLRFCIFLFGIHWLITLTIFSYFFVFFMLWHLWALQTLGNTVPPRASQFLQIAKGLTKAHFLHTYQQIQSLYPTTNSLSNSHTPSKYFSSLKASQDQVLGNWRTLYASEPAGIFQTNHA